MKEVDPGWSGPAAGRRERYPFRWRRVVWALLWPQAREQIVPTVPGVFLVGLCLALGMAAYNSANNILFITLSLLLACLILSGVLSQLNFRGLTWRLRTTPPWRVGQPGTVTLELRNAKRFLPTYGLSFDLRSRSEPAGVTRPQLGRLDPAGGETRIEWTYTPTHRGREWIELTGAGSPFPFGFLRKRLAGGARGEVRVWPAPVEYQRHAVPIWSRSAGAETVARLGQSGDLLSVRRYDPSDSHRLIHWKASARLRQLVVRQFAAEADEGLSLVLDPAAERWPRPEQFELLCRLAATIAEDLFRAGRLQDVALAGESPLPLRRRADLDAWLDRLADLAPRAAPALTPARAGPRSQVTFAPDGPRGVAAYVNGLKAATA